MTKTSGHLNTIGSRRSEPFAPSLLTQQQHQHQQHRKTLQNPYQYTPQNRLNFDSNFNNRRRLEHTPSARTVSSEESWCSERSEHDLSSDGEDEEKSIGSITSTNSRNSQLRSTLSKAKQHLSFDKWRNHLNNSINSGHSITMPSQQHDSTSPGESPAGRLSRWFSIRRGSSHQYDIGGKDVRDGRANSVELDDKTLNPKTSLTGHKMPLLREVRNIFFKLANRNGTKLINLFLLQTEEDGTIYGLLNGKGNGLKCKEIVTPTVPPTPPGLSQQELKRRHIFAAIVHSENSYVATLQRLVNVSIFRTAKCAIKQFYCHLFSLFFYHQFLIIYFHQFEYHIVC